MKDAVAWWAKDGARLEDEWDAVLLLGIYANTKRWHISFHVLSVCKKVCVRSLLWRVL